MRKRLRKIFLNIIVLFVTISLINTTSGIKAIFETKPDEIIMPEIFIDGKIEKLYKEFRNNDVSLANFSTKYKDELTNIKNRFNLKKDLEIQNWEEYYGVIKAVYNEDMDNSMLREFELFFDIFENKYKNNQIKYKVSKHDYSGLEYLLPVTSAYVEKHLGRSVNLDNLNKENIGRQKEIGISLRATSLPNMNAAINYATKHATNPNRASYHYFNRGDCANFVSQILEAGGVKQEIYNERYKGWWHKRGKWHIPFIDSDHDHSHAWSIADTFVRYMGVSSITTDHFTFSARINKGTIIAFDKNSDGDWDHVAFVVEADNYKANYSGKIYYDYKVAQHTSDYLEWTSSSKNGWENVGGRYAIVRQ